MRVLEATWAMWKVIAHKIGNFQARVLLSLFYFGVLGPFAVGVKMLGNPLRIHPGAPPRLANTYPASR